jgi:hypothetical protein
MHTVTIFIVRSAKRGRFALWDGYWLTLTIKIGDHNFVPPGKGSIKLNQSAQTQVEKWIGLSNERSWPTAPKKPSLVTGLIFFRKRG